MFSAMEHFRLDKSQTVPQQYANNNAARGNVINYQSQSNARNIAGLSRIPQPMRNQTDKRTTVAQQYAKNRQNLASQLREQWHDESPRRLQNARTTIETNKAANKVRKI